MICVPGAQKVCVKCKIIQDGRLQNFDKSQSIFRGLSPSISKTNGPILTADMSIFEVSLALLVIKRIFQYIGTEPMKHTMKKM